MQGPRLLRLLLYILRDGKLKHSGHDFAKDRREALHKFEKIWPMQPASPSLTERVRHPMLRALYSEASFIKSSLIFGANHLNFRHLTLSYVRIPRAGSTGVVRQMLLSGFPELRLSSPTAVDINHLASILMKRQLTSLDRGNTFFTIVRNPFARIVSVYRAFFENPESPFLYEDYLFGVFHRHMTFREFIAALDRIPDWLKDQHLKPQDLFLRYYEKHGIVVTILKLESPKNVNEFLKKFGIPFEVYNASDGSYDYRTYYDTDLVSVVGRIYRKDISRFGYDEDLTGC